MFASEISTDLDSGRIVFEILRFGQEWMNTCSRTPPHLGVGGRVVSVLASIVSVLACISVRACICAYATGCACICICVCPVCSYTPGTSMLRCGGCEWTAATDTYRFSHEETTRNSSPEFPRGNIPGEYIPDLLVACPVSFGCLERPGSDV